MAVGRIWNGTIRTGQRIAVVREEADDTAGAVEPGRIVTLSGTVTSLQTAHGIERVDIAEAGPGDIVSVAGLPEVTIGDTLTDPADPRPLPRLDVDAPTLRMTFGVNTSPLAGREGKYVTSRQIKARLEREVLGNVSIEVRPAESSEAFEVRGRGELQLAVLIEQMRREGFELTASRPEVLLREGDGEVLEPYERITIDIPPDYIGEIQTAMAGRKGRLDQMSTDTDGRVRMEFVLPVRGLIGYRGQLLTETRGTALLHQIGEGYGPWAGEVTHRTDGVLVSDRAGISNAYGLFNLEERAELFIGAGVEVYEGMIVGENSRSGDMDVNPTKEKKLTNIRTHSHDESLRLTPPRPLTLETALEFIAGDELVEVTPQSIRLRKRALSQHDRRREVGRAGGPAAVHRTRGRRLRHLTRVAKACTVRRNGAKCSPPNGHPLGRRRRDPVHREWRAAGRPGRRRHGQAARPEGRQDHRLPHPEDHQRTTPPALQRRDGQRGEGPVRGSRPSRLHEEAVGRRAGHLPDRGRYATDQDHRDDALRRRRPRPLACPPDDVVSHLVDLRHQSRRQDRVLLLRHEQTASVAGGRAQGA